MFHLISIVLTLLCYSNRNGVGASKSPTLINALCAGKTYEVQVAAEDTVGEVCSALCQSTSLKVEQHAVYYRGKVLDKKKQIHQLGIRDGDLISINSTTFRHKGERDTSTRGTYPRIVKSTESIQRGIKQHTTDLLSSKAATTKNSFQNKPAWDMRKLQSMLKSGDSDDKDFLASVMESVKTNPMDMIGDLMGNNYLEELVSNDVALESMRQLMKKNMQQYEKILPGFSQVKLLTSSPAAFKAAIQMAVLQMKSLRTSPSSSSSTSYVNNNNHTKTDERKKQKKVLTKTAGSIMRSRGRKRNKSSRNTSTSTKKSSSERLAEQIQYRGENQSEGEDKNEAG